MKKHTNLRLFYLAMALGSMALAQYSFFSGSKLIFSSHMAGHVILLLITAPFSVLAMRERPEARRRLALGISRRLSAIPWLNWVIGIGILWLWQVPAVFNTLLTWDGGFHQHLRLLSFLHSGSLLLAGILFCWPLAAPYLSHRLSPAESLLYLSTAWVGCTLLTYLIEFATPGSYGGTTPISRKDQLVSGLILWVPCCLLYLGGAIYLLREWTGKELWSNHHDFYRRTRKQRIKIPQEEISAGSDGEFVHRGGAIIPHHSAQ